jgi:uncharacterized protein (DUF1697 family)
MKYVALLRGINVGGNKKVPMADLKKAMEKKGLSDVRTLLASGNVVFSSDLKESAARKTLESLIEEKFGFTVPVILRTHSDMAKLAQSKVFEGIPVDESTRLYVSFLGEEAKKPSIKIPYSSEENDFRILSADTSKVCSVLQLSPKRNSVDCMNILEKEFGKNITTRNWNTVVKIAAL